MANGLGTNGSALIWLLRLAVAAFMTWAVADRIAVGNTLVDLRERVVRLETLQGGTR